MAHLNFCELVSYFMLLGWFLQGPMMTWQVVLTLSVFKPELEKKNIEKAMNLICVMELLFIRLTGISWCVLKGAVPFDHAGLKQKRVCSK